MAEHYGVSHMAKAIHFRYGTAKVHCVDTPGHRIRALRKAKELTQPTLAKAIGIDQSTLSDIERGAGINAATLMRLAEELEAPPDFIMGGRSAAWPFKKVAIGRFLALSPEDRAYVEGKLESAIEHCEEAALGKSPTQVGLNIGLQPKTDSAARRTTKAPERIPTALADRLVPESTHAVKADRHGEVPPSRRHRGRKGAS